MKTVTGKKHRNKRLLSVGAMFMATVMFAGGIAFAAEPTQGAMAFFPKGEEPSVIDILLNRIAAEAEKEGEPAKKEMSEESCMALQIDGEDVLYLASKEDGQALLDAIVERYRTAGSEVTSVAYQETVEIMEQTFKKDSMPKIMTVDEAVSYVLTGTKEALTYTVKEGDTYWDIAHANHISVTELLAMNPSADVDILKIGSVLNLYELKPFLHVTITEVVTSTENIDYEVVYEETSSLYKGETQVKVPGVYGKKEVKTQYVKTNGVAAAQTVLEETVISQPSKQVVLTGTANRVFSGGSEFAAPMGRLEVSSAYGSRGGGRHRGVDLRAPRGTRISAMAAGTVTYAGYRGTMGNIVQVSHGDGWETWYAHCDTMCVSVGQSVSKGQQIATVGKTGRATGYHLHLEVHKNGSLQNPMNYL